MSEGGEEWIQADVPIISFPGAVLSLLVQAK